MASLKSSLNTYSNEVHVHLPTSVNVCKYVWQKFPQSITEGSKLSRDLIIQKLKECFIRYFDNVMARAQYKCSLDHLFEHICW